MGYWKREYTSRRGGKPLFRPTPRGTSQRNSPEEERDEAETDKAETTEDGDLPTQEPVAPAEPADPRR